MSVNAAFATCSPAVPSSFILEGSLGKKKTLCEDGSGISLFLDNPHEKGISGMAKQALPGK